MSEALDKLIEAVEGGTRTRWRRRLMGWTATL